MTAGGAGSAGTRPTLAPVFAPDGAAVEAATAPRHRSAVSPSGLTAKLRGYDPKADTGLIDAAYTLAEQAHGTQRRDNGDPYITHPVAVADILAGLPAGHRLDRHRPAARRDRGHAGQAAGDPDAASAARSPGWWTASPS